VSPDRRGAKAHHPRRATGGSLDGKPGDANDIALLKGAMEALEQVSIEKNCNIEFQHG
jgi:hypothetical protein